MLPKRQRRGRGNSAKGSATPQNAAAAATLPWPLFKLDDILPRMRDDPRYDHIDTIGGAHGYPHLLRLFGDPVLECSGYAALTGFHPKCVTRDGTPPAMSAADYKDEWNRWHTVLNTSGFVGQSLRSPLWRVIDSGVYDKYLTDEEKARAQVDATNPFHERFINSMMCEVGKCVPRVPEGHRDDVLRKRTRAFCVDVSQLAVAKLLANLPDPREWLRCCFSYAILCAENFSVDRIADGASPRTPGNTLPCTISANFEKRMMPSVAYYLGKYCMSVAKFARQHDVPAKHMPAYFAAAFELHREKLQKRTQDMLDDNVSWEARFKNADAKTQKYLRGQCVTDKEVAADFARPDEDSLDYAASKVLSLMMIFERVHVRKMLKSCKDAYTQDTMREKMAEWFADHHGVLKRLLREERTFKNTAADMKGAVTKLLEQWADVCCERQPVAAIERKAQWKEICKDVSSAAASAEAMSKASSSGLSGASALSGSSFQLDGASQDADWAFGSDFGDADSYFDFGSSCDWDDYPPPDPDDDDEEDCKTAERVTNGTGLRGVAFNNDDNLKKKREFVINTARLAAAEKRPELAHLLSTDDFVDPKRAAAAFLDPSAISDLFAPSGVAAAKAMRELSLSGMSACANAVGADQQTGDGEGSFRMPDDTTLSDNSGKRLRLLTDHLFTWHNTSQVQLVQHKSREVNEKLLCQCCQRDLLFLSSTNRIRLGLHRNGVKRPAYFSWARLNARCPHTTPNLVTICDHCNALQYTRDVSSVICGSLITRCIVGPNNDTNKTPIDFFSNRDGWTRTQRLSALLEIGCRSFQQSLGGRVETIYDMAERLKCRISLFNPLMFASAGRRRHDDAGVTKHLQDVSNAVLRDVCGEHQARIATRNALLRQARLLIVSTMYIGDEVKGVIEEVEELYAAANECLMDARRVLHFWNDGQVVYRGGWFDGSRTWTMGDDDFDELVVAARNAQVSQRDLDVMQWGRTHWRPGTSKTLLRQWELRSGDDEVESDEEDNDDDDAAMEDETAELERRVIEERAPYIARLILRQSARLWQRRRGRQTRLDCAGRSAVDAAVASMCAIDVGSVADLR